jgi:hypothetical protein
VRREQKVLLLVFSALEELVRIGFLENIEWCQTTLLGISKADQLRMSEPNPSAAEITMALRVMADCEPEPALVRLVDAQLCGELDDQDKRSFSGFGKTRDMRALSRCEIWENAMA